MTESGQLMSASAALDRVRGLEQTVWEIQTGLAPPLSQDSKVFAPAALSRPLISSPLTALLIGIVGGIALAFATAFLLGRTPDTANTSAI